MTRGEQAAREALRESMRQQRAAGELPPQPQEDRPMTQPVEFEGHSFSAREVALARYAAKLAAREVEENFYQQVGRGVVGKLLVWVFGGGLIVAWAKGWIRFTPPGG